MRPYILLETNWKKLQTERFELAILPWGATEAHNYHLPYGTDVFEADALAAACAAYAWEREARPVVLPTVAYGVNTGQSDVYLDMNLNPSTQLAILDDIVHTLDRQGLKKLLLFNSHGGNNFKPLIRELGLRYPNMFICMCNWFQAVDRKRHFEHQGDHADEVETSLLLHLKPELVLPRNEWGEGRSRAFKISGLNEDWAWAEREWLKATEDTGVGNPSKATAEKGATCMAEITEKLGNFIIDLCNADPDDLYAELS